jgi:hypothetical protein
MIVASSSVLGKADSLVKIAQDLTGFVARAVEQGASFDDVEGGALEFALSIGHAAVELFLQAQGNGDLGEEVVTEEGAVLQRSEQPQERSLRTIFGPHSFQAYVYSRGSKRKIELRPIDARINLPQGKASYLLQKFSQMFCVEKAFNVGARQFEAVFQQRLSVDVLEGINRAMGEQADRFLDDLPPPPATEGASILVLTADGKGVPLVKEDARQVPVFEEKLERPGNRRMATLGCVYTVEPYMRTPEQIVAALMRDKTVPQPANRPRARDKHYRAYFAEGVGQDAVSGAYRTWGWMAQQVQARHRDGQPIVRLMDGQESLWDASNACLEEVLECRREAMGQAPEVVDILDIIHVSSYVWKAAKAFHGHKEHQEAFVESRLLRILRGKVRGVVKGMRRMARQQGLKGQALRAVRIACNYLKKNAARMRYDEYLRAGYPIATGVIEGACRHVVKDRMEQGGMRWTLAGAQAMLNVRSVCASSAWDHFGRWRQEQERQRLHPHRALTAPTQDLKA